ncbi:hypothetical protein L3X38_004308 [Prunus dulcis]|uniref:Uncharacterized protein n=1 Tax=Prunus dulcis TaxID=3755 RepID=A0AAD4ZNR6_PRUDU|nr:hypothetical protein L3X38_004308 [Prunus dulcis]
MAAGIRRTIPRNFWVRSCQFLGSILARFSVDSLGIKAGYEYVWEEEGEAKSVQVVALNLVARRRRNGCLKMAVRNIHERKKKSGFKNYEL